MLKTEEGKFKLNKGVKPDTELVVHTLTTYCLYALASSGFAFSECRIIGKDDGIEYEGIKKGVSPDDRLAGQAGLMGYYTLFDYDGVATVFSGGRSFYVVQEATATMFPFERLDMAVATLEASNWRVGVQA